MKGHFSHRDTLGRHGLASPPLGNLEGNKPPSGRNIEYKQSLMAERVSASQAIHACPECLSEPTKPGLLT
jgi:hypothetical protein